MIDQLLTAATCGSGLYGHPLVERILGDLHPGGVELTMQMADVAGIGRGDHVLDVGCGKGNSLIALAQATGCQVTGADVLQANVDETRRRFDDAGVAGTVLHFDGDVDALPTGFTAVLSECTLCLQGDAAQTLAALRRRLVPGGRLLLSDVTVEEQAMEFREVAGIAACLGGALPRAELEAQVGASYDIQASWEADGAIAAVRARIRSRIDVEAIMDAADALGHSSLRRLIETTEAAFASGHLGYRAIVADGPQPI